MKLCDSQGASGTFGNLWRLHWSEAICVCSRPEGASGALNKQNPLRYPGANNRNNRHEKKRKRQEQTRQRQEQTRKRQEQTKDRH